MRLLATLGLGVLLIGCGRSSLECQAHIDCETGHACIDSQCLPGPDCVEGLCPEGRTCVAGVCVEAALLSGEC